MYTNILLHIFRISMLAQSLPVFCSFLWLHLRMFQTTFYYRTLLLHLLQLQLQLLQYIIILGQTVGHLHGKIFAFKLETIETATDFFNHVGQRDRRRRALLKHQNFDFLFYLGWSGLAAQMAQKQKSCTTKSSLMQDWVFRLGPVCKIKFYV